MSSKRVAFLASGGGGNLRFLHRCIRLGFAPGLELCDVVADRECGALSFARGEAIPNALIEYSRKQPLELQARLHFSRADLIITNIHKIIDADTVAIFRGKMINLHYSLLPDFGGAIGEVPVQQALEAGRNEVGTTVHFVDESLDGGPIICQSRVQIDSKEPFDSLMNRVFRSGALNLIRGIYSALGVQQSRFNESLLTETFWKNI